MLAVTALALLLQDEGRREWEGFAEGSTATLRVTVTDGDKQESTLERYTIVKVAADSVTVKMEVPGKSKEIPHSLKKDDAFKKIGAENIDIDGKTFACALYEKTVEAGKARRTIRQWMNKDVPGRVAKQEVVIKGDLGELRSVGTFTRLNQRAQVSGKAVTYGIFEISGRADDGREATVVRWISEQVPGFVVKDEARSKREGSSKEIVRVAELIEFDVK